MANIIQIIDGHRCSEEECINRPHVYLMLGEHEIELCLECLKELAITINDYLEFLED